MKFTTLLLLSTVSAMKINEAPAKPVAKAVAIAEQVVPEVTDVPEGNETKPLTKQEIKEAREKVAWDKYKEKKAAFDEFIEEANLEEWRKWKNETTQGIKRYKEMAEGIRVANQEEIKVSKTARKVVKSDNAAAADEKSEHTKDEKWVYNMPEHVVKAALGPTENVTTAKIPYYPGLVNEPVMAAPQKPEPVSMNIPKTKGLSEGVTQLVEEASK